MESKIVRPASLTPPTEKVSDGWIGVMTVPKWSDGHQFLTWGLKGDGVCVVQFRHPKGERVAARVWFGAATQGGPGQVHGGAICAVLDQLLGFSAWDKKLPSVTANLSTDFRKRVVLGTLVWVEAWVERVDGRKVYTKGWMADEEGNILAEAQGLFILVNPEHFADDKAKPEQGAV